MSIIAEIAQRADVSVEGVMRVLTREPVSEDIKERVLAVLPELSPEQTRVLQRFALATLHDELPRQEIESTNALPANAQASAALESQLAPVLKELVEAIKDLRREANAERRERVDDLAVLVDVMTTGWQELDRRLGRVENMVGRIEYSRRPPTAPLQHEPARHEPPLAPVSITPPAEDPEEEPEARRITRRWPVAAALVAGLGIGLLAGLDVLPARTDFPGFGADRQGAPAVSVTTGGVTTAPRTTTPVVTRTAPRVTTTARPKAKPPRATPKPKPAGSVLGTTAPKPKPPRASTATSPLATTTTQPPPATGFTPARRWGWAPVRGADYYVVEFFHGGQPFYRATSTVATLLLPDSVVFRPGAYSWVVRPGFGKPAEKRLGASILDSAFQVTR